ncbi:MAG: ABC transporter ATP-binding protein, partial [Bifidobacteriaceae bacterium]|nr:ABC transporter ATP-binding protein [Bifidobacteriaceae bacterium]
MAAQPAPDAPPTSADAADRHAERPERLAEAAGLSVNLGGNRVIGGIDLAIAAGERVGLLGANGSGK